jgi:hypothetical protein
LIISFNFIKVNTLKCEIKRVGQNNKTRGSDSEIKETSKIKEKKRKRIKFIREVGGGSGGGEGSE